METHVIRGIRCYKHHTAAKQGYVSRVRENPEEAGSLGYYEEYNGRFGRGFVEYSPRWDTTWYCYVTYWIVAEEEEGTI